MTYAADPDWATFVNGLPGVSATMQEWERSNYPIECDPCCLYRYYTDEGDHLYTGISVDFDARDRAHFVQAKQWRVQAAFASVETFPIAAVATAAEEYAIAQECAAANIRRWPGHTSAKRRAPKWWLENRNEWHVGDNKLWALICCDGIYYSPKVLEHSPF